MRWWNCVGHNQDLLDRVCCESVPPVYPLQYKQNQTYRAYRIRITLRNCLTALARRGGLANPLNRQIPKSICESPQEPL